jgi:hypothetical protein
MALRGLERAHARARRARIAREKTMEARRRYELQAAVVERDDGRFQIGIADDAPAFETRRFAEMVAARSRDP